MCKRLILQDLQSSRDLCKLYNSPQEIQNLTAIAEKIKRKYPFENEIFQKKEI